MKIQPECRTYKERSIGSSDEGTNYYICRITLFPVPDNGLPIDECPDYKEKK